VMPSLVEPFTGVSVVILNGTTGIRFNRFDLFESFKNQRIWYNTFKPAPFRRDSTRLARLQTTSHIFPAGGVIY
jgi:hypothetical protein